ncbi:dynamin family protein [Brachyspira pulli]|uniref:dynamin family protein n=1 Tax=Brachyspira pulli TaxID=310721 RepID=UPI0030064CEE
MISNERINEIKEKILNIKKNIDTLYDNHADDEEFCITIKNLCNNYKFASEKTIEEDINNQINMDRALNLGIIGVMKAGKSSLLNSLLFEGKNILPKSVTPMTAALTYMKYSEQNYIEIDFVTEEDIKTYKKVHDDFENILNKKVEEKIKEKERAINSNESLTGSFINMVLGERKNNNEVNNNIDKEKIKKECFEELKKENEHLASGYENYNEMNKIKDNKNQIFNKILSKGKERIDFNNIEEVSSELKKYVGANGEYTPFVKSMNLYLNAEKLKKINIIDTPGFNDPIESRNKKTAELLKKCEAVFILTRSTKAFTESDKEVINKIVKKEGLREIYIILSKIDSSLNSKSVIDKSKGDLKDALDNILNDFYPYLEDNIKDLGYGNIFGDLKKNLKSRVLYSSSISNIIMKNYDNLEKLDGTEQQVFHNLKEAYPLYFDSKESSMRYLKLLSNIENIENVLYSIAEKKDQIFEEKLEKIEDVYEENAEEIQYKLMEYAQRRISNIENMKIEKEVAKLEILENNYTNIAKNIQPYAKKAIDEWYRESVNSAQRHLDKFYTKVKSGAKDAQDIEEEKKSKREWIIFKKEWIEKHPTVHTNEVLAIIDDYINNFNRQLEVFLMEIYQALNKNLVSKITPIFTKYDETIEEIDISNIVESITNEYRSKIKQYKNDIPFTNKGILKDNEAESFVNEIQEYIKVLEREFYNLLVEDNISALNRDLLKISFDTEILDTRKSILKNRKFELENQKQSKYKWNKIKGEIDLIL